VYVLSESGGGSGSTREDAPSDPVSDLIERLATALSEELGRLGEVFTTDEEAVDIRAARARLQFGTEGGGLAWGPENLGWTILHRKVPGAYSEPLPRVLWVYELSSIEELREMRSVLEGRLQALGIAGVADDVRLRAEELAVELGVSRVTPPGAMAWPPAGWRHDGRMQLMPLLRWTDFESETER
jgi:hypothetical protein